MSLESIRNTIQGPLGVVILGLIFFSFAIWGISANIFLNDSNAVATVEDQEILPYELNMRVENMKNMYGDVFDQLFRTDSQIENFRRQQLEQLINEKALEVEMKEAGVRVSDQALRETVKGYSIFQVDGKFDVSAYNAALAARGYTDERFRKIQRSDMLRQQVMTLLNDSELALPYEAKQRFQLQEQKRSGEYVEVKSAPFKDSIKITEEQIDNYYQENLESFRVPEKVVVEYVELAKEKLQSDIDISDEQAKKRYHDYQDSYMRPGPIKAAHIMIAIEGDEAAAKEKAQQVYQQILDGADFAEVAKQSSSDTDSAEAGGELGWQNEGDLEPALDTALFALEVGEISEPVKSEFGFHVLKNLEDGEQVVIPFEDVKQDIIDELSQQKAEEEFYAKQDILAEKAFEISDSLKEVAAEINVDILTTDAFTRNGGSGLAANPAFIEAAFSEDVYEAQLNSSVIELGDFHVAVLRLKEKKPTHIKDQEQVAAQIKQTLINEAAFEKAKKVADEILTQLKKGESVESILQQHNLSWQQAEQLTRTTTGMPVYVRNQFFSMNRPQPDVVYKDVTQGKQNIAILALKKVEEPKVSEQTDLTTHKEQLERYLSQATTAAFIETLKSKVDITRK